MVVLLSTRYALQQNAHLLKTSNHKSMDSMNFDRFCMSVSLGYIKANAVAVVLESSSEAR